LARNGETVAHHCKAWDRIVVFRPFGTRARGRTGFGSEWGDSASHLSTARLGIVWSFFGHSEPGQGVGRDLARKGETVAHHCKAWDRVVVFRPFGTRAGKGSDGIWLANGRQWLTFKHCKAWDRVVVFRPFGTRAGGRTGFGSETGDSGSHFSTARLGIVLSFFDHSEPGQGVGRDLVRNGETVAHI